MRCTTVPLKTKQTLNVCTRWAPNALKWPMRYCQCKRATRFRQRVNIPFVMLCYGEQSTTSVQNKCMICKSMQKRNSKENTVNYKHRKIWPFPEPLCNATTEIRRLMITCELLHFAHLRGTSFNLQINFGSPCWLFRLLQKEGFLFGSCPCVLQMNLWVEL